MSHSVVNTYYVSNHVAIQEEATRRNYVEAANRALASCANILANKNSSSATWGAEFANEWANLASQLNNQQRNTRNVNVSTSGTMSYYSRSDADQVARQATANYRNYQTNAENLLNQFRTLEQRAKASYAEKERIRQEREAARRREEARKALEAAKKALWQDVMENWDLQLYNICYDQLEIVLRKAEQESYSAAMMSTDLATIKAKGEAQVEEQKNKVSKEIEEALLAEEKAKLARELAASKMAEERKVRMQQEIELASLEGLSSIKADITEEEIEQEVNETVRKEAVKAIYKSLRASGFNVEEPIEETDKNGQSQVLIRSRKGLGSRAYFLVDLEGHITYKFDGYKGQACQEDISKVIPMLAEVYGVDLEEERVIWTNPDDIKKSARPINPVGKTNSKG